MSIALRPALPADYPFALKLCIEAIKPLASTWMEWADEDQKALFASLWRPNDTWIIALNGQGDIGWTECKTGGEVFLKQLYISPEHQGRGVGSSVMRRLEERCGTAKSMALFVLKNNPAFRFYKQHGFDVVQETLTRFVMRRSWGKAA